MKCSAAAAVIFACAVAWANSTTSNRNANLFDHADANSELFDKIADQDIGVLVDLLRSLDVNKAKPAELVLNFQGQTTGTATDDVAPLPLFKYVNESLLNTPCSKALQNLLGIFKADVRKAEHWNDEDHAKIDHFLDTMMSSKLFTVVWNFLSSKELAPKDSEHMKSLLRTLWFGLYSRAHGAHGSSGFEHVFFGEWNENIVEGQHFWIRFYLLEKQGQIDYKGYIQHHKNFIATIRYKWKKYVKRVGGFLIGTSPEFDFSVFTLCFFAKRGEGKCHFNVDGVPLRVTSFKIEKRPYIATTYPIC